MNCEDFRAAYLAGAAGERENEHLSGCASCRSRLAALDVVRDALDDGALWEEPSAQLGDQVVGLVSGSRSDAPTPAGRGRVVVLGAVAVLVVLVGVAAAWLLRAPDWVAEVPGTDLAPEAQAVISGWNTESGTRLEIETSGLEAAPDGFVYELWLSEGPAHVSAGTFRASGEAELWVGVSRGDYPRLWVTLEEVGPYTGPSPMTVLDTGP